MRVKQDLNNVLRGTWMVPLSEAACSAPCHFCAGFWCPCCFAYQQRNKILDITGEPYVCCGGSCICCQQTCDNREPWLCLEACCCTSPAILANRYMIQTRFDIQNDPCDETMLALTAFINMAANCAEICMDRESARHLEHIMHLINACICSCMLTQQHKEIERIEQAVQEQPYGGPPQHVFIVLPPEQQSMVSAAQALRMPGQPPMQQPPMQQQPMHAGLLAGQAPPPPAAAPGGLVAQGRQVMVTVPPGVASGQMIAFMTPEGSQSQVVVPQGLAPGQQFVTQY